MQLMKNRGRGVSESKHSALVRFAARWPLAIHSARIPKERIAMARIPAADPSQQGLLHGIFTRIIYSMVKRKVGRVVMPVKIAAHHAKLLWGYGQMEQSLFASKLVDAGLKNLAQLRVATLVGCPF